MIRLTAACAALSLASIGAAQGAALTERVAEPAPATVTSPLPADKEKDAEDADTRLGDFGACLAAEGRGQLILLLDQSSSLATTDPDAERTTASTYLINQLAGYATKAEATIDVQVAGFADEFRGQGWHVLAGDRDALLAEVTEVSENLLPMDTDYVNALQGARRELAERRGDLPTGCQAVAWFTDGEHILDIRSSEELVNEYGAVKAYAPDGDLTTAEGAKAVTEAGKKELCREGGSVDQLRDAGVTILGFGLSSASVDLDFFTSAVTGDGCGSITEPPGSIFRTDDPADLLLAFDTLASPKQPPTQVEVPTCTTSLCPEGVFQFTLDDAISQVHVLATSDTPGAMPVLKAPSGTEVKPADVPAMELADVGGKAVEFTLSKKATEEWSGPWQLAMAAPDPDQGSVSNLSVRLESTIETLWPDELEGVARAGEPLEQVALSLVDSATGATIDPTSLAGQLQVNATLTDAAGQSFPIITDGTAADIATPVDVDLTEATPGEASVLITTMVTTADAKRADGTEVPGTTLKPRSTRNSFTLSPAADFPVVGEAVFEVMDGVTEGSGHVRVTGPGCAWLAGTNLVTKPAEATNVEITSPHNSAESCLSVADGEEAELPIAITVNETGNGALGGELTITGAPADEITRTIDVPVRFNAEMLRPLDAKKAAAGAIVGILFGLLIPLLILYGAKYVTARIPAGRYGWYTRTARLGEHASFPVPDNADIAFVTGGGKTITFGEVTLKAKMSLSPLGSTRVEVTSPDAPSVGSGMVKHRGGRAVLPHNIAGQWLFIKRGAEATALIILDGDRSITAFNSWPTTASKAEEDFAQAEGHFATIAAKAKDGKGSSSADTAGGEAFSAGSFESSASAGSGPVGSGSAAPADSSAAGSEWNLEDSADPWGFDSSGDDPWGSSDSWGSDTDWTTDNDGKA